MPRPNPVDRKEFIQRVALYQNMSHGFYSIINAPKHMTPEQQNQYTIGGEYVRLSEWMDIDLQPLSDNRLTEAALNALAQERAKLVNDFKRALEKIDERIQNFQALTFDGGPT